MEAHIVRKYRVGNSKNKSGFAWRKLDAFTVQADTVEELLDAVYNHPLPDKFDSGLEAVSAKGSIRFGKNIQHRKTIIIDVFRTYTEGNDRNDSNE